MKESFRFSENLEKDPKKEKLDIDIRERVRELVRGTNIGEGYAAKVFDIGISARGIPICAKVFRPEVERMPPKERFRRQPLSPHEEFRLQEKLYREGFRSIPMPAFSYELEGNHVLGMEKIIGYSLKELMEFGGRRIVDPPWSELRRLVTQLHKKHGVIHRDLHPGNIMLRTDQDHMKDRQILEGELVIIDFGTARRVFGSPEPEDYQLTIGNSVIKFESDDMAVDLFEPRPGRVGLFKE